MLTLASLLVMAILAPAPASELRTPAGPASTRTAAVEPCPCKCTARTIGESDPGLRDPFDAPQRTTQAPALRDLQPSPARRMRAPGPKPSAAASELRSPFDRA